MNMYLLLWLAGLVAEPVRGVLGLAEGCRIAASVVLSLVLALGAATGVTVERGVTDVSGRSVFESLPPGNVLFESRDVANLVTTTIPQLLAMGEVERKQYINDLGELGTVIGVAFKRVERISGSIGYARTPGVGRKVALIIEGGFDGNAVAAMLRREGNAASAVYRGQTILSGLKSALAFTMLDRTTVLVGSSPDVVRGALDARYGSGPNATTNAGLYSAFESAARLGAGTRVAFSVPQALIPAEMAHRVLGSNAPALRSVEYVTSTLDTSDGFVLGVTVRTRTEAEAKTVFEQLNAALKKASNRGAASGSERHKSFLESPALTVGGRDVVARLRLTQDQVNTALRDPSSGSATSRYIARVLLALGQPAIVFSQVRAMQRDCEEITRGAGAQNAPLERVNALLARAMSQHNFKPGEVIARKEGRRLVIEIDTTRLLDLLVVDYRLAVTRVYAGVSL